MKFIVWNECYVAGGADWSLIDLIQNWPNKDDEFTIYINKTHEGYPLLASRLKKYGEIKTFTTPLEILEYFAKYKMLSKGLLRKAFFFISLYVMCFWYKPFFKIKYDALLMNNGGYPGGLTNFLVSLIAKKKGINYRVMIVRNYPINHVSGNLLMKISKKISESSMTKIITVSNSLRNSMIKKSGIDHKLLKTIYNGISIENKVSENTAKDIKEKFNNCSKSIGIIGTIQERKGHFLLFSAFSKIIHKYPGAKLFIIASSSSGDKKKIVESARELKIEDSIEWIEFTEYIGDVYELLDVVVMPSLNFESFGRVVVEAMAFRKPIIGSIVGGIPELIDHGKDGFLFNVEKTDELADLIDRLFSDNELRIKMGEEGEKKFKNYFSAAIMAENYATFFNEIKLKQ